MWDLKFYHLKHQPISCQAGWSECPPTHNYIQYNDTVVLLLRSSDHANYLLLSFSNLPTQLTQYTVNIRSVAASVFKLNLLCVFLAKSLGRRPGYNEDQGCLLSTIYWKHFLTGGGPASVLTLHEKLWSVHCSTSRATVSWANNAVPVERARLLLSRNYCHLGRREEQKIFIFWSNNYILVVSRSSLSVSVLLLINIKEEVSGGEPVLTNSFRQKKIHHRLEFKSWRNLLLIIK